MKDYNEDEFLMLSGIQHFAFCRRQWAPIHIEQVWADNYRTVDGNIFHERTHDEDYFESRNGVLITRGLRIFSRELGFSGNCDVVEFHEDKNGITLKGRAGTYLPFPIEYKRGKPKEDEIDILQLCAQAICLEEMLSCDVMKGALYYGETRHRVSIDLTNELKDKVKKMAVEMHQLYEKGHTPKVKISKKCKSCSLQDICLPKLNQQLSVEKYFDKFMSGE